MVVWAHVFDETKHPGCIKITDGLRYAYFIVKEVFKPSSTEEKFCMKWKQAWQMVRCGEDYDGIDFHGKLMGNGKYFVKLEISLKQSSWWRGSNVCFLCDLGVVQAGPRQPVFVEAIEHALVDVALSYS